MAHCTEMKLDQVWVCDKCGLQIKVVKECSCSEDPSVENACPADSVLTCCGSPLKLRS
jgi:hypothetical protein